MAGENKPQRRAAEQAPLPERVGRYEVLLKIASGGMATVYLARAQGIGGFERQVALKLMHSHLQESPEFADDLVEEAKLAVRIRNAHVASVLDVGEDPLGIYLVMDYVEGETLAGLQRLANTAKNRVPMRIGMRILVDALSGLHAAHEVKDGTGPIGIVHRDFSPQNILVGLDGIARLTDFGIAKAATRLSSTSTGIIKGKIAYMAPEQARGETVDRRCDVWAAGVLAWHLATGTKLYKSDNDLATLMKIATTEPPRARSVEPSISQALDDAIAGALTLDLAKRCPTASALRQALIGAARSSDGIAEHEEVAEYVATVAGPRLAERRSRVAELLDLRVRMGKLADVPTDSVQATPIGVSVHAAPDKPGTAPASEPALDVGETVTRAAAMSSPDAPIDVLEEMPTGTNTVSVATTDSGSVVPPRWWRASVPRLAIAGTVVVALLGVVIVALVLAPSPSPTTAATSTATSTLPAPPLTPPAETTTAVVPKDEAPVTHRVEIRANAPLAVVHVNGRAVKVPRGADELVSELSAREAEEPVQVDATTTDGRRASVAVPVHATEARLVFPAPPPAPKPTATAAPRSTSPFVSTSPYDKHK